MQDDTVKSISELLTVDRDGITFIDGERVSFEECAENFKTAHSLSQSKCVSERDITADPPYFLFYTEKRLKLLFDSRGISPTRKNKKAFIELQLKIQEAGFTTYDLS